MTQLTPDLAHQYQLTLALLALSETVPSPADNIAWMERAVRTVPQREEFEPRLKPVVLHYRADGNDWRKELVYDPETHVILGAHTVAQDIREIGCELSDEDIVIEARLPGVGRVDVRLDTFGDTLVLRLQ